MTHLTCPGCKAAYPLAAVRAMATFRCSVCGQTMVVPMAVAPTPPAPPPAPVAAPARRPAPAPAPARPAERRRVASEKPKGMNTTTLAVVGGIVVVGAGVVLATMSNSAPAPATPPTSTTGGAATPTTAPAAPKADPEKDVAAWKALSAAERQDRAAKRLSGINHRDVGALRKQYEFFLARGESEVTARLAQDAVTADPDCAWAHAARGDVEILPVIEACLAHCARADDAQTPGAQKLAALKKSRAPTAGTWWADAKLKAEVDALVVQVNQEEKSLDDPFNRAVAKWIVWQRTIHVMRDYPALTGTTGPYLLFVQIKAPAGTPMDKIDRAEIDRAQQVLKKNQELFASYYDGVQQCLGGALGLPAFDASKTDDRSLLKANIFADESTWRRYHKDVHGTEAPGFLSGIRAYYSTQEPRFICTYDAGGEGGRTETSLEIDQVQCHEATHQVMHSFTWEISRAATGKEPRWEDCDTRPPWLEEGFAEFFSSHSRDGGKRAWMQPLEGRMEESWTIGQIFAKKGWADWSLDEFLSLGEIGDIAKIAARRVTGKGSVDPEVADLAMATDMLHSQIYGRGWSLCWFLWNDTDAAGKPRWRDGFQKLLRQSLRVDQVPVTISGPPRHVLTPADFKKALGFPNDESYRAFEKAWVEWERRFLAENKRPSWETNRDRILKKLGLK